MQEAGIDRDRLALAAARECNSTRCGGHTTGHGASNSRALDFRDHPRGLLAFGPGGRPGSDAKGRGSAYSTQIDPSCRNSKKGKLANSMMGLVKVGRGERI